MTNLSKQYTYLNVSQLDEMVPSINWEVLLTTIFNERIYPSERILVRGIDFFRRLDHLLKTAPKRWVS